MPHDYLEGEAPAPVWRFAKGVAASAAATGGFAAEANDGFVGTVAVARDDHGFGYLIVHGGPWNGGRTVMLPGGVVKRVDSGGRLVLLSCSREQIRCAPLYENDRYQDGAYRRELADYYAPLGSRTRSHGLGAVRRIANLPAFGARGHG